MTQPYGPPPQPGYYYGPLPQQQQQNGVATGGFVTALVGAVLALIPILGVVSWVISPIGLVLSIVGLTAAPKRGGAGRGMAVAGIALGAIGLLICVLYAAAFSAAFEQGFQQGSSNTPYAPAPSYSAPSYGAPSTASTTAQATPSVNGPFDDGTYLVGEDIAPGTYRTDGASEDSLFQYCAAIRQDANGRGIGFPESTNTGPAFVTVRPSDGRVEFVGQCTWTRR